MGMVISLNDQLDRVRKFIEAELFSSALSIIDGLLRSFKELPNSTDNLFQIRLALLECAPGVWNEMYSARFAVNEYSFDFMSEMQALENSFISRGARSTAFKMWVDVSFFLQGRLACDAVIEALQLAPKDLDEEQVESLSSTYTEGFWAASQHISDQQSFRLMCKQYLEVKKLLDGLGADISLGDLIEWIEEFDGYGEFLIEMVETIYREFEDADGSFDHDIGVANYELGKFDAAVATFARMVVREDEKNDAVIWLARSYIKAGVPSIGRCLLNEVLRTSDAASSEFEQASKALDELVTPT
ncbi:hypothetical protein [Tabrizicola caldifontis]|uniref:hypothetical protein n=1 Tax=Tabrizicola caldifontis TaxID=2528036 RepID=UPI001081C5B2|nr:hypothetical protein [Rhodobacter sp. YIM 73028]